jgi:hypothetical protein
LGSVERLKVGFALLSSATDPAPSTRIACINVFPSLRALGVEPFVLFDQPEANREPDVTGVAERAAACGCHVVVLQKIHGDSVLRCVARLRALGIATVYSVCDFVDDAMASAVDRTAAVTRHLRSLYAPELHQRIDVVHDGIERPELRKVPSIPTRQERPLAALVTSQELYAVPVVGAPPAPWRVNVVGQFPLRIGSRLQSLRWALMREASLHAAARTVGAALHPRVAHTPWSPDGVYEELLKADIGIIPVDTSDTYVFPEATVPTWQLKSENRLTLKMALGLPVIASPIPSYELVIEHGKNGLFARSGADWRHCFNVLRDPALRLEMGTQARLSVLDRYSIATQAKLLAQCIQRALDTHLRRSEPKSHTNISSTDP